MVSNFHKSAKISHLQVVVLLHIEMNPWDEVGEDSEPPGAVIDPTTWVTVVVTT